MDETMITELKAVADYIRGTRIPLGELEAIKRLLGCAETLDGLAGRMEAALAEEGKRNETDHK